MKKLLCALAAAAVALCGCSYTKSIADAFTASPEASSEALSSREPENPSKPDENPFPEAEINTAILTVPGFEEMPAEALMGVKSYGDGSRMKWMEVNALPDPWPERVQPVETEKPYFIVIPRFVGSAIKVQSVEYNKASMQYEPGETLYAETNIPDGYGLIVNNLVDGYVLDKIVTVTYKGYSASYDFSEELSGVFAVK
ncbi:MAG: hypothetical protein LBC56_01260 [Oscillospiraceae bacterium]|jgi:hypothetical protein|nr:hypothetical protein [Oscillospiraceae bacterium]